MIEITGIHDDDITWKFFSPLLALCAVTGEFPTQRPVTRNFDVFFDLGLKKRLSKQSRRWWFETPWRPLWRHSNYISLHNGQRSWTWWIITVWRRDTSYHDFIRRKFANTVHGLIKIQKKILNNCPVLSTKAPGIQGMYNMYWPYKKNPHFYAQSTKYSPSVDSSVKKVKSSALSFT